MESTLKTVIKGKRIYLREVRVSDVNEKYYRWLNDPEVSRYLETRFVSQSMENILEFVKSKSGSPNEPFFAICLKEDNNHIGNIKLGPINWNHRNADVSLIIGEKNCWGKGYATEAIKLVTSYAFHELNINKLKAGCYAENLGSARAFKKCGYRQEGLLKGHVFNNGKETDLILLGVRKADFDQKESK